MHSKALSFTPPVCAISGLYSRRVAPQRLLSDPSPHLPVGENGQSRESLQTGPATPNPAGPPRRPAGPVVSFHASCSLHCSASSQHPQARTPTTPCVLLGPAYASPLVFHLSSPQERPQKGQVYQGTIHDVTRPGERHKGMLDVVMLPSNRRGRVRRCPASGRACAVISGDACRLHQQVLERIIPPSTL
jgi:hypothetical protein